MITSLVEYFYKDIHKLKIKMFYQNHGRDLKLAKVNISPKTIKLVF